MPGVAKCKVEEEQGANQATVNVNQAKTGSSEEFAEQVARV